MKKNKIKEIENNIEKNFPLHLYETKCENLFHIKLQSEWLLTQEGQESVGEETAKKMIEQNNIKVENITKELSFIAQHIH